MDKVLRVHMELNCRFDEEEKEILRKYGYMKESISRDILVPEDITLHALSYAILRLFGWQNSHLHSFNIEKDTLKVLTDDSFMKFKDYIGVYFRYPSEDFEDLYWDDNYNDRMNFRSWLKLKYTGPYKYKGKREHYLINQMDLLAFLRRNINIHSFNDLIRHNIKRNISIDEASLDDVGFSTYMNFEELIERLKLKDVLAKKGTLLDYSQVESYIHNQIKDINTVQSYITYQNTRFTSYKKQREYLDSYNPKVLPITDKLIYKYDFGLGWEVNIEITDIYDENHDEFRSQINEVLTKHRPVCIYKDGIELIDDMNVYEFAKAIKFLHEYDDRDPEQIEQYEGILEYLIYMGFTGAYIPPEKAL